MKNASEIATADKHAPGEVGMSYGIPLETFKRKVRIFSPARTAGQQGIGKTIDNFNAPAWRMAFSTEGKWVNPLMGWTSTADPLEHVGRAAFNFYTKEEAIAFAVKSGWSYEVAEPNKRRTIRQKRYMGYGDNFSTKRAGLPDLTHLDKHSGVQKESAKTFK